MKKLIVFCGMFLGVLLGLFIVGIMLDMTILRQAGSPGYTLVIFVLYPMVPAIVAAIIALGLTMWITRSSK